MEEFVKRMIDYLVDRLADRPEKCACRSAAVPAAEKPETTKVKVEPKKEMKAGITLDQMKQAAKKVAENIGDVDKVKATIARFGEALKDVEPGDYLALLEALDELQDQ